MTDKGKRRSNFLGNRKGWLLEKLREAANLKGGSLSRGKFKRLKGFPSSATYEKYFGSWNNAKREAGISVVERFLKRQDSGEKYRDVPLKLRFFILKRDGFSCQYCGRTPRDGAKLMVDHVTPYSKGGLTTIDNLLTACFECNIGKRDSLIELNDLRKTGT